VPVSGQRCSRAVAGDRAGPKPGAGGVVPGPAYTGSRAVLAFPDSWAARSTETCMEAWEPVGSRWVDRRWLGPPGRRPPRPSRRWRPTGSQRVRWLPDGGFTWVARSALKRRVSLEPPRGSLTGAGPRGLAWDAQAAPAGASLWLRDGWWSPARSG